MKYLMTIDTPTEVSSARARFEYAGGIAEVVLNLNVESILKQKS